jgi:hypothetical protein
VIFTATDAQDDRRLLRDAVAIEANDEWLVGRSYISQKSPGAPMSVGIFPRSHRAPNGRAGADVRRRVRDVVADILLLAVEAQPPACAVAAVDVVGDW